MLGDLRVSLYELFAHLLPGTVLLVAAVIGFWVAFYPGEALEVDTLTGTPWYLTLLLAYLTGLGTQAAAGLAEGRLSARLGINLKEAALGVELRSLVAKARHLVDRELDINLGKGDLDWLFRICDEAMAQAERAPDRESYRYREGLFRGLTVAFFALALAVAARGIVPDATFRLNSASHRASTEMLLCLAVISAGAAILSFLRFRDIRRKRFARAVVGFVVQRSLPRAQDDSDSQRATDRR